MMPRATVCMLMIAAMLPIPARAEHTRYWRESEFFRIPERHGQGRGDPQ